MSTIKNREMELIDYTSENLIPVTAKWSSVYVHNDGTIKISKTACRILGLKSTDKIAFHQDKSRLRDWYISKNDKGLPLNDTNKRGLQFHSRQLALRIMRSLDLINRKSVTIPISIEATEGKYFALITKSVNNE